jgi:hypothetical protein
MAGCSDFAGSGQGNAKPFDAMSGEEHLACAVEISAYSYLIAEGTIPEDQRWQSQALLALGWHHNAYAIRSGKGEQYALLNQRRVALIAQDTPDAIAARAELCIKLAEAKINPS